MGTTRKSAEIDEQKTAEEIDIAPDDIVISSLNPRIHFDPAKLQDLADSLRVHGQMQNLVVYRTADGAIELIAGERRLRAAKLAQLATVRCKVLSVTREKAIELRGIENLVREDLSAVETARWYEQMIDFCGFKQVELAERLGVSQGTVANRLRLLKLPNEWQERILRGEIFEAHGRWLVPYCDVAGVMRAMAERLKDQGGECPSVAEWQNWLATATAAHSQPVDQGATYNFHHGGRHYSGRVLFLEDDLERHAAELDIRDCYAVYPGWGDKNRRERRAFNVDRWIKLHSALVRKAYDATTKPDETPAAVAPRPVSSANRRASVDADLRRRKADEALAGRLVKYREAWLRRAITKQLLELDTGTLAAVAAELGIDFERDWKVEAEFLELHNVDQLRTLASEWGITLPVTKDGNKIVRAILIESPSKMPKSLQAKG